MVTKPKSGTLLNAVKSLWHEVNTPYSRSLQDLLEKGGIELVAKATGPDPRKYGDAHTFSGDYLSYNILRKLDVEADRDRLEREAFASFRRCEVQNSETNKRLRSATEIEDVLSYAKQLIYRILGPLNVKKFCLSAGWGPGSTASLKAADSTVDKKITEVRHSVTPNCSEIASIYLGVPSLWRDRLGFASDSGPFCLLPCEFTLIDGGELTTVSKSVTARRVIDPQPTLNLFFQKSVGSMIRAAMMRHGVDISNAGYNQSLAAVAHIQGLCTIDLKDASNTLSHELVYQLLPREWYTLMSRIRTHYTYIEGEKHKFEMFSAMGNGFTFELESLIFYALSWALVRAKHGDLDSPIAVFGDDIIVSSSYYQELRHVLMVCGFTVNVDKTYSEGPFYESCGKHYFNGIEVTPVYQKTDVADCPSLIRFTNRLVRWGLRADFGYLLDNRILATYRLCCEELTILHDNIEAARRHYDETRRKRFIYRPVPTQHFMTLGDVGVIDIDRTFLPYAESVAGWVFKPIHLPGREDALLIEALRASACNSTLLLRPYGCALEGLSYPNGEIRQIRSMVPTYGKVVPRRNGEEIGRYVWSDVHVYHCHRNDCGVRALVYAD